MTKLLFLFGVIILAFFLLRRTNRAQAKAPEVSQTRQDWNALDRGEDPTQ